MSEALLVLNAGSSSLKFTLFATPAADLSARVAGSIEELFTAPRASGRGPRTARRSRASLGRGAGPRRRARLPVRLAARARSTACARRRRPPRRARRHAAHGAGARRRGGARGPRALVPLAPLHQPHNLLPIRAIARARSRPAAGRLLRHRLPRARMPRRGAGLRAARAITERGVRRYGFHGLSYEYIASVLPQDDRRRRGADGRAASRQRRQHVRDRGGRSVATTMGFTALDGLPMGTRSGSSIPGVVLYLMQARGMDAAAIEKLLYRRVRPARRLRHVERHARAARERREPRQASRSSSSAYRIGRELGSLAAALGGLDAVVFTAGIGENAAPDPRRRLPRRRLAGARRRP
jgi:acetate kinase